MKRYSKSQLNAISRSYVRKGHEDAVKEFREKYGVDYNEFCLITGYKASPRFLLGSLFARSASTMEKMERYFQERKVKA